MSGKFTNNYYNDWADWLPLDFAVTRGKRCKRPVSLVDLYPTLVELCGLPARDGLDGRSIAPMVRNPETEWQYPAVINLRDNHAVRSQRWHYIRYADGGEELYDAAGDPINGTTWPMTRGSRTRKPISKNGCRKQKMNSRAAMPRVAKLVKSFGSVTIRKSRRLSLPPNRTLTKNAE